MKYRWTPVAAMDGRVRIEHQRGRVQVGAHIQPEVLQECKQVKTQEASYKCVNSLLQ